MEKIKQEQGITLKTEEGLVFLKFDGKIISIDGKLNMQEFCEVTGIISHAFNSGKLEVI